MSEVKLVLTDIDGTMVAAGEHDISPAVQDAVRAVEAQNIPLTAVTGRPYSMMRPMLGSLGLKDLGVFDCGASIHDVASGELVWKRWMDRELVRKLASILMPHCTEMLVTPEIDDICKASDLRVDDITDDAPTVFGFVFNEKFESVHAALSRIPGVTANPGPRNGRYEGLTDIQITRADAGKYHGVNALREIVHSDREHTLAIGDSHNDIPLFQNAGIKVAMGNAVPELRALADYVVAPVEQDGFAEAMHRFVLR